ncbi:MAG TPA: hypothetical protein VFV72_04220 [Candidatus Limnocylindrales bacterium]|nr:hypothetical protein [Candidatus Limnocylindrales bacterium]
MRIRREAAELILEGRWYRLRVPDHRGVAWLEDEAGRWAELRLLASVDGLDGVDETLEFGEAEVGEAAVEDARGGARATWRLTSSRWAAKRLVLEADDERLAFHVEVEGRGPVTDVSLLFGRTVMPRRTGTLMSGAWFESIVCASPTDPGRIVRPASESAVIGVVSGSEPGRGNWFFTPGPFVYAANRAAADEPVRLPDGSWLWFGLRARGGEAGFTGFAYRALDRGFGFTLDYEGKAAVDGAWRSPAVAIGRAADPYAAIDAWRSDVVAWAGGATGPPRRDGPTWWRQPIFCGWGAQGALATADGEPLARAPLRATQANYDGFLAELTQHGIRPGTIVLDDKWQAAYGTCEPDPGRWPNLGGWIAGRRAAGQRVLLWYKAWDAEGVDAAACIRTMSGVPLGLDPTSPAGEAAVRSAVARMLGPAPGGLAADGLKIDFTAATPSGVATRYGEGGGGPWGVDLLRRLLDIVADEARRLNPEALLVGHTPNPIVASAVDMLRLNDTLRLDDPRPVVDVVPQMTHRAAVVRAACPDHLVDTDDWCAPSLAGWRAYAETKPSLGVPALYYTTSLDLTGERFQAADYELIRRTWAEYRLREGLREPG